jgi:hypothetical protein
MMETLQQFAAELEKIMLRPCAAGHGAQRKRARTAESVARATVPSRRAGRVITTRRMAILRRPIARSLAAHRPTGDGGERDKLSPPEASSHMVQHCQMRGWSRYKARRTHHFVAFKAFIEQVLCFCMDTEDQ